MYKAVAPCLAHHENSIHFIYTNVIIVTAIVVIIIITYGLTNILWWPPDSWYVAGIPQEVSLYLVHIVRAVVIV